MSITAILAGDRECEALPSRKRKFDHNSETVQDRR